MSATGQNWEHLFSALTLAAYGSNITITSTQFYFAVENSGPQSFQIRPVITAVLDSRRCSTSQINFSCYEQAVKSLWC